MKLEYASLMRGWTEVLALAVAASAVSSASLASAATEATAAPGRPDEVLGLFVWYKADSLTGRKDGDIVTQWNDSKSGKLSLDKHTGNPVFVSTAINQLPAVRFKEGEANGLQTLTVVDALAGNPNFTVFLVAKVARPKREHVELLSWGNAGRPGSAVCLQVISDRLNLATGFRADAVTPDGAYATYFGKPAIVMCAKAAGPLGNTTRITLNGTAAAVTGSDIVPKVMATTLNVGAHGRLGYVSPTMDVAEIIVYDRLLSLDEQNRVGYYLQEKYGIVAHFTKPIGFLPVVRMEPVGVEASVGCVEQGRHAAGAAVDLVASQITVVHSDRGPRAFVFDHWQGDVAQPLSCRTAVQIDKQQTITAVYREQSTVYYVAPNGRDAWPGTLAAPNAAGTDGPFARLARARDAIRQLKSQSGATVPRPIKVLVRGGKYFLDEPLVFGPEDSGTQQFPVTYAAYPGETPILSGGHKVTGWQPYKGKILQASIPEGAGGKWKFRELFYHGKCQFRASAPKAFDPLDPLRGGWTVMEGGEGSRLLAFKYKAGSFSRHWAKPTEAEANVFTGSNEGPNAIALEVINNIIPIKSLDEQKRVVTLVHSATQFVPPAFPGNQPQLFASNHRYRIENVLDELTEPGEWCWHSDEGRLYFWPPDDAVATSETVVPVLNDLIALRGTSHVNISGMTLTETNGGDNYFPEGLDGLGAMFGTPGWKYCGDAVQLEGTHHCRIEKNRFLNIGGNAIFLKGPCRRNLICGNEMDHVGAGGVCLAGKRGEIGKEQYPRFNEVLRNRIHRTGVMNFYSVGIFLALSEGNVVGHNSIREVPHHAINLGNTGRSHNIVEYNEIHDACLQINDTAAINCWMEADARDEPRQGHIIRHNLIVDSRESGIYLDNSASNCLVYGNVILRFPYWGIILHGGKNNVVENNIVIASRKPCATNIRADSAAVANYDLYAECTPGMAAFSGGNRVCYNIFCNGETVMYESYKRPDREWAQLDSNLIFNADNAKAYLASRQQGGYELHSLIADPMFVDPEHDDYRLKPESPALRLGFQPIDVSQMGPQTPRP